MMILPSVRHLRYLTALHDHGHFGRAAEACHVTQSTLSASIKELESVLQAALAAETLVVIRLEVSRLGARRGSSVSRLGARRGGSGSRFGIVSAFDRFADCEPSTKLKSNSSPASPPLSWQPTDARDLHSIWTR